MSHKANDIYEENKMEYLEESHFDQNFDEWKALGYLKSYPFRRLNTFLIGGLEHIDNERKLVNHHINKSEVYQYEKDSDKLLDEYIENSERELLANIPF